MVEAKLGLLKEKVELRFGYAVEQLESASDKAPKTFDAADVV